MTAGKGRLARKGKLHIEERRWQQSLMERGETKMTGDASF